MRTLANAGIRVAVAVAPVLPHLTDGYQSLRDVYRAAAEAGAALAWTSVLRLGDGARESYFEFLRREFPQLVAHYRATYANGYLARPAAMRLDARIADAKAGVAFKQRDAISPRPSRVQLSLL